VFIFQFPAMSFERIFLSKIREVKKREEKGRMCEALMWRSH